MRWLYLTYNLLWIIILPIALLRLVWRARKNRAHLLHFAERLGYHSPLPTGKWILIHAVSVGETRAAQPLVEALLKHSSQIHILLTHMTLTGYQTGTDIFAQHIASHRLRQAYLPYDLSCCVKRFIQITQPKLGILIETEIWPNLIFNFKKQAIPLVLANARMSSRSFKKATRLGKAAHTVFNSLSAVLAQTTTDAEHFNQLGAKNICVTGNLKFDIKPQTALIQHGLMLRQAIGQHRPVLCAASTREGEELIILNAWKTCQHQYPWFSSALLLLVPRHPERCQKIIDMMLAQKIIFTSRSALTKENWSKFDDQVQVLIGDSLGEMTMYYSAADVALIGGSLLPFGGQNLIEACALGKPVLFGPYMFNFTQPSEAALAHGAAIQITNEENLAQNIANLLSDQKRRLTMSLAAVEFSNTYRGAVTHSMRSLEPFLKSALLN